MLVFDCSAVNDLLLTKFFAKYFYAQNNSTSGVRTSLNSNFIGEELRVKGIRSLRQSNENVRE